MTSSTGLWSRWVFKSLQIWLCSHRHLRRLEPEVTIFRRELGTENPRRRRGRLKLATPSSIPLPHPLF